MDAMDMVNVKLTNSQVALMNNAEFNFDISIGVLVFDQQTPATPMTRSNADGDAQYSTKSYGNGSHASRGST